ncbi:MAG: glycosyltransferase family 4 protein [Lachnospiraceae bacterium]|nr:glycosyltransferase family 4 protein [Lachnospiraceae bacterium]
MTGSGGSMKVLWLCNIMLPTIAEHIGVKASNREGWLTGLTERFQKDVGKNQITLGVCFPTNEPSGEIRGQVDGISYYGFYEDVAKETEYEKTLDASMEKILADFQPDMVHIFGTEFPHTLAMVKAFDKPDRTLIGMQGVCAACAEHYMDGIPSYVQHGYTFRDFLKKDNIAAQQGKFQIRAGREAEALKRVNHVTGRTELDKTVTEKIHPGIQYHFMNETLRSTFYQGKWDVNQCRRHTIFVSQGDYPLKGFHYFLQALPCIRTVFPDTRVYVAGNEITRYDNLKSRLKLSSYGKYLRQLMSENDLEKCITFLGMVDSNCMCQEMLKANVVVSPSTMENSPNSVGEAMLLGAPVVASRVGGTPSILTDEEDGFLYPAGEVNLLANCVCKIFSDDALANRLSENARAHAAVTHDPEKNYKTLLQIYKDMTAD